MTTEQPKPASTPEQPPALPPPPAHFALPPPPPGFLAYPPPTEGQQSDSNGAPHPPYPVMYPPGMFYFPPQAAPASTPAAAQRPKRKQVKMACTNCAAASKRCDEGRPCERCKKYGTADSCIDGQRKERKKGIKRGPYKRKSKLQTAEASYGEAAEGSGEYPPPPPNPTTTAIYAVGFPPPEGYYPVFYPPPGTYPLPEGQPAADGAPSNGQPPPMLPFYIGGFPPFPYPPPPGTVFQFPPPPGAHPPPPAAQTAPTNNESEPQQPAEKKTDETTCVNPAELSDAGTNNQSQADGQNEGGEGEKRSTPAPTEGEANGDDAAGSDKQDA